MFQEKLKLKVVHSYNLKLFDEYPLSTGPWVSDETDPVLSSPRSVYMCWLGAMIVCACDPTLIQEDSKDKVSFIFGLHMKQERKEEKRCIFMVSIDLVQTG